MILAYIAPLAKFGAFVKSWEYFLAVIFGFFFGFILERSGFADSRNITAVFYFKDFRVPKVMFVAILVAMIGIYFLGGIGVFDLSKQYIAPTYILPQLVGGLLFGIGMVMGGYCPGTSLVASVNFKFDGIAFALGIFFGIFVFGEIFDHVKNFYNSTFIGKITFMHLIDWHPAVFMVLVIIFAFLFFGFANKMEEIFSKKKEGK